MVLWSSSRWPSLTGAVLLALAALIANALVSYRALHELVQNNQWVVHTLEVLGELDATLSLMKDAEAGQRGYLLTNDPAYLKPYQQATAEIYSHLDALKKLSRDNPYQQSRIPRLQELVQERLGIAGNTVELQQAGQHEKAASIVASNLGKQRMDELRQLLADMRQHENQLLEQRTKVSEGSLLRAVVTFLLASFIAVVFVLAFFAGSRHELQEKTRAGEALREREAWLHTTLHSIGDAVIATDEKGNVKFINGVAARLLGYSSQEVEGKPLAQVFPIFNETTGAPAVNPVVSVLLRGAISGLANHTVLRNHHGEEIPIEDSAAPIRNAQGKITGVVLVFRDVSQQRRAQESARTSEKLAATGRLAATIAHEINNPLEAATNLLYLARTSSSPEEIRRYVDEADHELSRMAHITRKTLAFHRSSSVISPTNLRNLLEEVLKLYEGRIQAKHVRAEIDCAPDLQIVTVQGDLMQIISNLVANALDASDPGGFLRVKARAAEEGVRLEVEDNGSGIPAENLDKVFEPFFTTKKDTGTGLGLWVVKDLVEKRGGKVTVVSSPNGAHRGTCFSVFLPYIAKDLASDPKSKAS